MAATLPLELLQLIGDSLKNDGVPLSPCTTVCRWWKEAFEPFIYSRVVDCSTHANEKAPVSGIPVDVLEDITSQAGAARRMMIRAIEYRVGYVFRISMKTGLATCIATLTQQNHLDE